VIKNDRNLTLKIDAKNDAKKMFINWVKNYLKLLPMVQENLSLLMAQTKYFLIYRDPILPMNLFLKYYYNGYSKNIILLKWCGIKCYIKFIINYF
jgi:hypothetical protein